MRMKRLLGLLPLLLVLAFAGAAPARPTASPALLTYAVSFGTGPQRGGLCLARPDGSEREWLTRGFEDWAPSWSPDGRYVAFSRNLPAERASRIVVADSSGRVIRQFGSGASNTDPTWSPDGQRIAYSADRGGSSRIVVASALGQVIVELRTQSTYATRPTWSPDGKWIAYVERPDTDMQDEAGPRWIVVIGADGSGRRIFAKGAGDPAWSPDGSEIAFVLYASRWPQTGDIAVASVDGRNQRRLRQTPMPEARPAWSPDGKLLAFTRGSESESAIVVSRPDGTDERVVVRSPTYGAFDPAWRPAAALPAAPRQACH